MDKTARTENMVVRLTHEEKQKLSDYAQSKNITLSELIRQLCEKIFNGE